MKKVGVLAALAAVAVWAPMTRAQTDENPGAPQAATPAPGQGADPAATEEPQTPGRGPATHVREGRAVGRNRNVVLLEAFREEVKRVLQADEQTNADLDDIFGDYIEEQQQESGEAAEQRREQASQMRDMVAELRDAQRDGDRERIEDLRARITEMRKSTSEEQTVDLAALQSDVREVLDDGQFERYMTIQQKYESRFSRSKNTNEQAMQRLRQALASVTLSDEQREHARELFVQYTQKVRQLRSDQEKAAEAVQELRDTLMEQLDDNQADAFEQKLTELEQRDHVAQPAGRDASRAPVAVPATPPADAEQGAEEAAEHGEAEGGALPPE